MSAGRSVDLSVTTVSPAQTAEPIVMPFGKWTWVGPRNIKLDGVQVPICEGEILRAKKRLAQDMSGHVPFSLSKLLLYVWGSGPHQIRGSIG